MFAGLLTSFQTQKRGDFAGVTKFTKCELCDTSLFKRFSFENIEVIPRFGIPNMHFSGSRFKVRCVGLLCVLRILCVRLPPILSNSTQKQVRQGLIRPRTCVWFGKALQFKEA